MNDFQILPDDPKLTAYALGELEGDERAAVEAALRLDPALRAAVDEIRATTAQLEAALADEAHAPLAADAGHAPSVAHAAIVPGHDPRVLDGGVRHGAEVGRKLLRFPGLYYLVGGLAAACFAVMVALRGPAPGQPANGKTYVAVALPPTEKAAAEPAPASEPLQLPASTQPMQPIQPMQPEAASAVTMAVSSTAEQAPPATGETKAASVDFGVGQGSLLDQTKKFAEAAKAAEHAQLEAAAVGNVTLSSVASPPPINSSGAVVTISGGAAKPPEMRVQPVTSPVARNMTYSASSADQPVAATQPASTAARAVSLGDAEVRAKTASTLAASTPGANDVVMLSPFEVSAGVDRGYAAANTLAGTRLNSNLADAAGSVTVVTKQQLDDTSALNVTDVFHYATNGAAASKLRARPALRPMPRMAGNTEAYAYVPDNEFLGAEQNPLSTFSIDTDTASYANVRRFLEGGQLPPKDAVRIEELLNYFPYRYAPPAAKDEAPFAASLEVTDAPWSPTHRLVRIGLQGRQVATADRAAANLVFLLDVSGSMDEPNKLPLVKESMRLLVGKLRPDDRVAIVTYAGHSGLALPSTPVARSREIFDALDNLVAAGSTNGAMGIQLAYDIAKANFVTDGINRVILCTDGDFNVGVTSQGELTRLVQEKAKSGVFLTVLGFGMGNYKDSTLELLADKGNGNYGYIDTRKEAEKLLVEQVSGTLVTIAKDVKIQVEFNPEKVESYRLIGYENRMLKKEDFNNDKVDAGEIGAGHTVTALYEIVPVGAETKTDAVAPAVDDLKYQPRANARPTKKDVASGSATSAELLTVKVRYKKPDGLISRKLEFPLTDAGRHFLEASADFKFAAAVAEFGMILRDSPHKGSGTLGDVIAWAAAGAAGPNDDPGGYRSDFLGLARRAQMLMR
ncbi:MAG TPA: von Willebrand factor type A domain-containing protein [Opitutaceae bacterium]|nr:von Willebrand factor type A domain-containing protein [Opitutaceae bacterium]